MLKMKNTSYYINEYKVRIYLNGICEEEIFFNAITPSQFLELVYRIKNSISQVDKSNLILINSMINLFKSEFSLM
jgi:hypothetical protein